MAATLAVAVVLAAGLTACGDDDRLEPGAVVPARTAVTDGTKASVLLPVGTVGVVVGNPVGSIDEDDTKRLVSVSAPEGGSFVPVSLDYDSASMPWGGALTTDPRTATVSLVVDGTSYDVGSPYDVTGDAIATDPDGDLYVAMPGRPERGDITVDVAYDGVSQTVAGDGRVDPGRAAGLYDLSTSTPPGVACPSSGWSDDDPDLTVRIRCQVNALGTTPYFPGAGWAPEGSVWTVVIPQVDLVRADQPGDPRPTSYRVTGASDRTTIDGEAPREPMRRLPPPGDASVGGTLVGAVPDAGSATVRLQVAFDLEVADLGAAGAPDTRTVVVSRTLAVPPLRHRS